MMMERQNSSPSATATATATTASPVNPLGSFPASPSPAPPKRRRKPKSTPTGTIFSVFRAFAILGPLGFAANVVYFQFYLHGSEPRYPDRHPFRHIHQDSTILDRVHHHRQMTGRDDTFEVQQPEQQQQDQQQEEVDDTSHDEQDDTGPTELSGTAVLQRLQKQAASSWKQCGSSSKATLALARQLQHEQAALLRGSAAKTVMLEPFGLREALDIERKLHNDANNVNVTVTTSATAIGTDQCMIPQVGSLPLCQESTYSIIVTFQGEMNFRPLFMNLLSWLTYPSVSDIVVLMPHNDWGYPNQTVMDAKYKNRLQTWHGDKQHKVSMIGLPQTLHDTPRRRYSLDTLVQKIMSKVTSKAVLFMDGSMLWNGNLRGIHSGFQLWKQHPHAIVATHKLHTTNSPTTQCPRPGHLSSSNSVPMTTPFCQTQRHDKIPDDINALHQQYQNVLDMNGVFLHRDMLCLLQQPPLATILVQSVWRVLDDATDPAESYAIMRTILATALLQISGRLPLLFPSRVARPTNETKDYNDNWHYLSTQKETERFDIMAANDTLVQQRMLVSLLGYFGTGLAADAQAKEMIVPYWCASQKRVDDEYFMSDIPWIEGGRQNKC